MANLDVGIGLDVGVKRRGKSNQDSLGVNEEGALPIFVVADGMGGHEGGKLASHIVVDTLLGKFSKEAETKAPDIALNDCVHLAHKIIREKGKQNENLISMGTTVSALVLDNDTAYLANIGDSRIYYLRGSTLSQLSIDQSWVAEQVREGKMTIEEAERHPNRNRLTMSLIASREHIKLGLREVPIKLGDIFVLCSDGLWGMVPDSLIASVIQQLDPQAAAEKLVSLANSNGGNDNIAVIIVKLLGTGVSISNESSQLEDTNPNLIS